MLTPLAVPVPPPTNGTELAGHRRSHWSGFGTLSVLTLITLVLAAGLLPDAAGQGASSRMSPARIVLLPGVGAILAVIFSWMLAHNTMYTYLGVYLRDGGTGLPIDRALVVFGLAALVGIGITGTLVDRALRRLVLASIAGFIVAAVVLLLGDGSVAAVLAAIVVWGIAFGGAAAQLQTAMGAAAGENADVANGLVGVAFNLAIFAAGIVGGGLIATGNPLALPGLMSPLAAVALMLAALAHRTAFPRNR